MALQIEGAAKINHAHEGYISNTTFKISFFPHSFLCYFSYWDQAAASIANL